MELLDAMKNMTIQCDNDPSMILFKSISATIDDTGTEIIFTEYANKMLLIISQHDKVGSMLLIKKEQVHSPLGSNDIYTTKVIFGAAGEDQQVAGRYLAEAINIEKPICLFMNLKTYNIETIKACKDIILDLRKEN